MVIETQIVVSLLIVLSIQTFIILFTISKLKGRADSSLKAGLAIGSKIPQFTYENIAGQVEVLNDKNIAKAKYLVFLDPECQKCSKLLKSLDVFSEKYLKDMKIILKKTEVNKEAMQGKFYEDNSLFVEEEIIFNQMNIQGFPFIFKVNEKGDLEKKGYISKNILVDYFI